MAPHRKQQTDQQRGQEHAENIRSGGRTDRSRHVSARHGGEGNGGLHGGWQDAEEQHAHIKRRRQNILGNEADCHTEQREQAEGHEKDRQMQAPVQDTGNHHIPGKPRAVEEEQQSDREFCRQPEVLRRLTADRQNGGQNHGGHQHHGEAIR